jgi:predicted glycogen debranching enzyme
MSYLKFDSAQLVNLEYSLNREILRTNRGGSYSCTSIIGCNTRKYHGLLVCPLKQFDDERFVFLSTLDETVVQHNSEFNFGIHKFEGETYYPKGHKYVQDFEADVVAEITFRVGGVLLKKESLLVDGEEQILIKYTLLEARSATQLRLRPFLAFRNIHHLTHANLNANTKVTAVKNGIMSEMYSGFPGLHMQLSKKSEFIQAPDWYYNVEYQKELERGYDYKEDLFVPGYFEMDIEKGESIIFSASLKEDDPKKIVKKFNDEFKKRPPRDSFKNCLITAAKQFVVRSGSKTEIIAGYPWFGSWGRDTFISLPGLSLAIGDEQTFFDVVDTMVRKLKGGLFPNMGSDSSPAFNSVDAPLWFFWSLQQFCKTGDKSDFIWEKYSNAMKDILKGYSEGASFNIKMQDNGLIFAGAPGKALTWMDAVVHGVPVTPRSGYQVEINALWYNALCFTLELAQNANDKKFVKEWQPIAKKAAESFLSMFWVEDYGYLADYIDDTHKDMDVRPNMVIATSMDFSPLNTEQCKSILDVVTAELLTPRGLRTLSPKSPYYKGIYEGSQEDRDRAYHQGTVWPWLLEHYCYTYLKVYKKSGVSQVKRLLDGFEEEMTKHGISTIAEIYNGNPPHQARGAISQAWSVAALLQIFKMLETNY